ncbi:hypothetical protein B0T14DRAFT_293150 [Immersiella caudata]|uniref:Zn(2)-C6 fungal-type domain-containing protein n=1 Tax=Immersiella caudata TaxID=314043 RepID=A0AA40BUE9_9PEZI|nr:hypothetical protein B0T14DRAFT_293150 [Immersiella caudata]
MSEAMQYSSQRPSRAERTTTSCGECRRRKQKCNQGQPCSNCARRFPQPPCEYKSRRSSAVRQPAVEIHPPSPGGRRFEPEAPQLAFPPEGQVPRRGSPLSSPAKPWPGHFSGEISIGEIPAPWPGVDFPNQPPGSIHPSPYAWSTTQNTLSTYILVCEDGCTSHSHDVHEAVAMLRAYRSTASQVSPGNWSPESGGWGAGQVAPGATAGGYWPEHPSELIHPHMPQPVRNEDLLTTYVKLISQFKASLDGNPDPSNPYIRYHVPYCVQSPLLVNVAIYTAACFLSDTGHIDTTVAMAHKGHAIQMLNEHIQSTSVPSDEGITGVVQLIVDEWYWGDPNHLHTHLRGLREMIKLRGGFRTLGLHGLISKLAITSDAAIALSFETSPFLRGGSEFEFQESVQVPLRLALNTPFIPTLPSFSSCEEALRIHPATASILDEMRFLLGLVLALPENPSTKETTKVATTSAWIHDRILGLPPDGPTVARRLSAAASPAPSSAAGSAASFDARGTPEMGDEVPLPPRNRQPASRSRSRGQRPHAATGGRASLQPQSENQDRWERPESAGRRSPPAADQADYIYQAVRLAALIYSQAIKLRRPFSSVVNDSDFMQVWTTAWRVPLSTWRTLLGIFNWVLVPLLPSGKRPHDRFVKTIVNVSLFQMGMDNWEVGSGAMDAALKLQRWLGPELREPSSAEDGGSESEQRRREDSSDSAGRGGGAKDKGMGKEVG